MFKFALRSRGPFLMLCLLGAGANEALVGAQDEDGGAEEHADGTPDGSDDDKEQVTPLDCPELPPAEGAPCSQEAKRCEYDDCILPISKATCTGGRWVTEADGCPAPPEETCPERTPAAGDACSPDAVAVGCRYDCASGLPADNGIVATCTSLGLFELNDDACRLCGGVDNPAGCSEQNPCAPGFTCLAPPSPGAGGDADCGPSACSCDTTANTWNCLPDCGGFHCVENDDVACAGTNNPQGCSDANPCAQGQTCMPSLEPVCLPSRCTCNAQGGWDCTDDCSGGQCG